MVRYISERDVARLLGMPDAIACVERAFRDRAEGRAVDVPRERTKTPFGSLHVLQAASTAINSVGFKAYFPGRAARTFLVHLIDLDSGRLRAIVEADEMGIRRTGAATAVATRALSRPEASVVACFGSGRHALTQLRAVCAVRPIRHVRTFGRTPERSERFAASARLELGLEATVAPSAEAALDGADVVNVVTRSETPVVQGSLLAPGQHINAVGSNALDRREIDLEAVRRCDVVVVDSVEVARRECGDLLPAVERGLLDWHTVPDLGAVLTGRAPGRRSAEDVTLFESQGMGMQDLYVARFVFDAALAADVGLDLPIGTEG